MHETDPTRRPMMAGLAALAILALAVAACTGGASPSEAASAPPPPESQPASEEPMTSEEPAPSQPADGETITITNATSFGGVGELTVAVGTTVTFVNDSSFAHTVTHGTDGQGVSDPAFDELLSADATVTITFDEAGEFAVTCLFHPVMNMVVTVE